MYRFVIIFILLTKSAYPFISDINEIVEIIQSTGELVGGRSDGSVENTINILNDIDVRGQSVFSETIDLKDEMDELVLLFEKAGESKILEKRIKATKRAKNQIRNNKKVSKEGNIIPVVNSKKTSEKILKQSLDTQGVILEEIVRLNNNLAREKANKEDYFKDISEFIKNNNPRVKDLYPRRKNHE